MDKTVPAGAAILLDFIRRTEVGRTDRASYDVIYGHNQGKLSKPITSMTIGELVDAQASFTKRFKSSASGGYQFMRKTLQDLSRDLRLNGRQTFDPDLQDRLGYHLLKRRGYEEFMTGTISMTEFAKQLAMEWASFPVLAVTKGQHQQLKRGQSYYDGDALNKALVSPEAIEAVLRKVKEAGNDLPVPVPEATEAETQPLEPEKAKPVSHSKRFWTWLTAAVLPAVGLLDWRVQLASVVVVGGIAVYAIYSMPSVKFKVEKLLEAL
ncbi:membrane protein [Pseudochrobactrum sp. AO18b]|uniref:membrane protein n=1 Tax=Pseudochrobactrum sp. AO18b TaxID=1201036 RepID=UPI00039F5376|nr:membrane protein [Pseudochrobactrum sp. AO18b]